MFPSTTRRVPEHTSDEANRAIVRHTAVNVRFYANCPDQIDRRLDELDREWDIERMLEANAATLSLIGATLAATQDRRWLVLPGLVAAFLLQHATQGWCPPLPVLRRLGFRTSREIEVERTALKALRGDFREVDYAVGDADHVAGRAIHAARR